MAIWLVASIIEVLLANLLADPFYWLVGSIDCVASISRSLQLTSGREHLETPVNLVSDHLSPSLAVKRIRLLRPPFNWLLIRIIRQRALCVTQIVNRFVIHFVDCLDRLLVSQIILWPKSLGKHFRKVN